MIGVIVIQVKNVEMQMNSKKEELRGSGNCMMGEWRLVRGRVKDNLVSVLDTEVDDSAIT